jgi:hypothetical protein
LVLHKAESFQVPAIIADVGPEATKQFFEFFTVPIRNKNTRRVLPGDRSVPVLVPAGGFSNLEDIEPIHMAAYIGSHKDLARPSSSKWPQSA